MQQTSPTSNVNIKAQFCSQSSAKTGSFNRMLELILSVAMSKLEGTQDASDSRMKPFNAKQLSCFCASFAGLLVDLGFSLN